MANIPVALAAPEPRTGDTASYYEVHRTLLDAGKRAALRQALATVYWLVLAPAARATASAIPMPVAVARGGATQDKRDLLLRLTAREAALAAHPDFDSSAFQVWSDERICVLAGISRDASVRVQTTLRDIHAPDDARKWLISWWAGPPPDLPLGPDPLPLLRLSGVRWDIAAKSFVADASLQSGLLDLSKLTDASAQSLDIGLNLKNSTAGMTLVATLKFGDGTVDDVTAECPLDGGESSVILTIKGDAGSSAGTFSVRFSKDKQYDNAITHAPALQRHAYVELSLKNPPAGQMMAVSFSGLPEGVVERLFAGISGQALRDHAALLYASAFMQYILAGVLPTGTAWAAVQAVAVTDGQAPPTPVPPLSKISNVLKAWVPASLATARAAIKGFTDADSNIAFLFDQAIGRAIENANAAADAFVPPDSGLATGRGITMKAAPIIFPVDQPQPVDDKEDLWSMFAGLGLLAGRSNGTSDPRDTIVWPTDDAWHSLNVAEMHVFDSTQQGPAAIDFINDSTLVRPEPYDPVPVPVCELGGVRGGCVTYSNRTLIGEMVHDPLHQQPDSTRARKRTQAYAFPPFERGKVKLPSLCFGKLYFFLPYLIGHGGALPVCLRDKAEIATKMRGKDTWFVRDDGKQVAKNEVRDNHDGTFTSIEDGKPVYQAGLRIILSKGQLEDDLPAGLKADKVIRQIDYRRTTPVSAPRLDLRARDPALPGIPENVPPLASEIPIAPAPITLRPNEAVLFYRNKEATEGVLEFDTADPSQRAVQIDIGGLPAGSTLSGGGALPARPSLDIEIFGRHANGSRFSITVARIDAKYWPQDSSLGIRLTLGAHGVALLTEQPPDAFVERPASFALLGSTLGTGDGRISKDAVDMSDWRSFGIGLNRPALEGVDAYLTPPAASIGRVQLDHDQAYAIPDARLLPPGETAHQKRVIHVLDGILPATKRNNRTISFVLRRPDVEFSTYERWINWTMTPDVTRALNRVHDRLVLEPSVPGADLTLDDPAVERLVVECVQLFPRRRSLGRRFIRNAEWTGTKAFANPFRAADDTAPEVVFKVQVAEQDGFLSGEPQAVVDTVSVVAGSIYELRFYGAVPLNRQRFAEPKPGARFGPGVWEGLLCHADIPASASASDTDNVFRLGAPLTLTIEVATAAMPPLADQYDPLDITRTIRPDRGDVATTRLPLTYVGDPGDEAHGRAMNYQLLRYVSQVALLNQRWSWRGRTLPSLPDLSKLGDQALRIDQAATRDFEDIAFIDRRVDDIGVIEEARLQLAHVLPPARTQHASLSPMFLKDLQYRGGANWWRFALRATSRYAAMRPDIDLVRFSHRIPRSSDVQWHTLLVRDRDTGRVPKRPGLMLVLPLTECLLSDAVVPPLLAIFSEPMFPDFHIGDGLEATLEYARHPLPDVPVFWASAFEADQAARRANRLKDAEAACAGDPQNAACQLELRRAQADFADQAWSRLMVIATAEAAGAQQDFDAAKQKLDGPPPITDPVARGIAERQVEIAKQRLDWATERQMQAKRESELASAANEHANAGQPDTSSWRRIGPADLQRFWPEIGPDPVLTGEGHDGVPVPIRLDGPLGYTFDRETEAPRFGRSGFVVTPVPQSDGASVTPGIAPWTLARLKFRRLEAIETSTNSGIAVTGQDLLLRCTGAATSDDNDKPVPEGVHEGVVIDFPVLNASAPVNAVVQVAPGTHGNVPTTLRYLRIVAELQTARVAIRLDSDLGPAGSFLSKMMPAGVARLRLVLSQRDPPEESADPYEPVVDVSVRLWIDDRTEDGSVRSQAGAWLTVACLPLLAGGKSFLPGAPVYARVKPVLGAQVPVDWPPATQPSAYGVRLTAFTAPQWCQFTQDVSTFEVVTKEGAVHGACPVSALVMTVGTDGKSQWPVLSIQGDALDPIPLNALRWLPARSDSQLAGEVALIVTRYVRDAFDRERETPVAIYRIVAGKPYEAHGAVRIWPAAQPGQDTIDLSGRGRARLMTLMRWQKTAPGGGSTADKPAEPPASLQDYFGEIDEIGMEANDARGRILGISAAIDINQAGAVF
ncbi:hypothetical protein [Paraburkholderia sp. XV]|uniref:hypothetical protein n=1 Tax=Paraburkholderia sp. XV TaxID=2831520 RepID=UPI001CD45623|nr:hypothetical protein [Paraburkholderia sp. XV]